MMNRTTGRRMSVREHIQQSITDILSTPMGSRVMRRTYGSLVPDLIDQPDNLLTQTRVFSAVASALMKWEPRVSVQKMNITRDADTPGRATLDIQCKYVGEYSREGGSISLSVPVGGRAAQ